MLIFQVLVMFRRNNMVPRFFQRFLKFLAVVTCFRLFANIANLVIYLCPRYFASGVLDQMPDSLSCVLVIQRWNNLCFTRVIFSGLAVFALFIVVDYPGGSTVFRLFSPCLFFPVMFGFVSSNLFRLLGRRIAALTGTRACHVEFLGPGFTVCVRPAWDFCSNEIMTEGRKRLRVVIRERTGGYRATNLFTDRGRFRAGGGADTAFHVHSVEFLRREAIRQAIGAGWGVTSVMYCVQIFAAGKGTGGGSA